MTKRKFVIISVILSIIFCGLVAGAQYLLTSGSIEIFTSIAIILTAFLLVAGYMGYYFLETHNWFSQILDLMEQPLSITDPNMNWTFINKPVEGMLSVKRSDMLGKHCSTWGAKICNTEDCGVNCLRKDRSETFFDQFGMNFRVNTNYLYSLRGKQMGHIEVVTDITDKVQFRELKTKMEYRCEQIAPRVE